MYDEFDYWAKRGHPTSEDELYTDAHIDYIRRMTTGADRILDFGPGIGRTFPAYAGTVPSPLVEGYDITEQYRERALKAAMELNIAYVSVLNTSGDPAYIPHLVKVFDVAVACSVLMHQRPQHIVPVMRNLARVASKVVVMAWMTKAGYFTPHEHMEEKDYYTHIFNYNYFLICNQNGWVVTDVEPFREQIFFTYKEQG